MSNDANETIIGRLPVTGSPNRLQVVFQGRDPLEIDLQYWVDLSLKVGMSISEELLNKLEVASQESECQDTALRFLRFRARTEHEVVEHLQRKDYHPSVVTAVTEHLKRLGVIDDEVYVRTFAEQQLETHSKMEVSWKLRQRGVNATIVDSVLNSVAIEHTELEAALRLGRKQLRKYQHKDYDTCRVKVAAHLQRKGFTMEIVYTVLTQLADEFPVREDS